MFLLCLCVCVCVCVCVCERESWGVQRKEGGAATEIPAARSVLNLILTLHETVPLKVRSQAPRFDFTAFSCCFLLQKSTRAGHARCRHSASSLPSVTSAWGEYVSATKTTWRSRDVVKVMSTRVSPPTPVSLSLFRCYWTQSRCCC